MWRHLITLLAVMPVVGCSPLPRYVKPSKPTARAFIEAEPLFHRDPRWLGADGALSVALSRDRILWLFGDTFVATSNKHVRSESRIVKNSVAIQLGADPRTASLSYHWREERQGSPTAFFGKDGERWYWPGHGVRIEHGPLIVFLYAEVATPGNGLGFASAGYAVAIIDDPDAAVETWHPRVIDAVPDAFDAVPATAVTQEGEYIVAMAIRQQGTHAGSLVRYRAVSLAHGDLTSAQWWAGDARGWVPASSLGTAGPAVVLEDAGSECSLHWDERTRSFIHVASYGFGASTIGVRTAATLTGPWSSPLTVYRPPESDGRRPFVYAAKAHPELTGPDPAGLIVTYATNSFQFADLLTRRGARSLYWPRFVVVDIGGVRSGVVNQSGG
jgi:hypothetical protein